MELNLFTSLGNVLANTVMKFFHDLILIYLSSEIRGIIFTQTLESVERGLRALTFETFHIYQHVFGFCFVFLSKDV